MARRALYGENSDYLIIFPSKFSTFLKSGLFSGSSSQQLFINMYIWDRGHIISKTC